MNVKNCADGFLLAVCDSGLIGKKFEQGNKVLDLSSNFYDGVPKTEEEILKLVPNALSIDFVGEDSVAFAIKRDLVDKDNVIRIKGIPHAQCVFMR